jgi:hypothetical protein
MDESKALIYLVLRRHVILKPLLLALAAQKQDNRRLLEQTQRGVASRQVTFDPSTEVDGFYWTVQLPDIVNSRREEQGLVSV